MTTYFPNKINKTLYTLCKCGVYERPHRLGGGKCTGFYWIEKYMLHNGEECTYCIHKKDNVNCDVLSGLEPLYLCPGAVWYSINQESLLQTDKDIEGAYNEENYI